jgi:hypothetical protein
MPFITKLDAIHALEGANLQVVRNPNPRLKPKAIAAMIKSSCVTTMGTK